MDVKKLKEYLAMLVELEKNKYTQKTMIADLEEDIKSYQEQYSENATTIESWSNTTKTVDSSQIEVDKSGKGIFVLSVYALCVFIASLAWCFVFLITRSQAIGLTIGAAVVIVSILFAKVIWKNLLNKRRQQALLQMQRQLRIKNNKGQKITNEALQTNQEISSIIPQLQKKKDILHDTLKLTEDTLTSYYASNIIPPKYRSLVPVCMFYDYIANGRTYSIQRDINHFDEGAINIYEQEKLQRIIISKLDEVIDSIDRLSDTQRILCNAIQESNEKIQHVLYDTNQNLKTANEALQVIQYQNEQRNQCLEYMSYIDSLQFFQ